MNSHIRLILSLSFYALSSHWLWEAIYYLKTPEKYGPWFLALLLTIAAAAAFYDAQIPFFERAVSTTRKIRIRSVVLLVPAFINVILVLLLTLGLVFGVKGLGNLASSIPVVGEGQFSPILALCVIVFLFISLAVGWNTAVKVVNMRDKKNGHEKRSDLVVFLSIPSLRLLYDEKKELRVKPYFSNKATGFDKFSNASSTYITDESSDNDETKPFNNLIPPIKGIQYHYLRDSKRGPLKRVFVICSEESKPFLGLFYRHLEALFGVGTEHGFEVLSLSRQRTTEKSISGGSTISGYAEFSVVKENTNGDSEEKYPLPEIQLGEQVSKSTEAGHIDFEDSSEIMLALELALEHVAKNCQRSLKHIDKTKQAERQLVIDCTGGMKPCSIAAAMMTVGRHIDVQYVRTNNPRNAMGFDFQVLPKVEG